MSCVVWFSNYCIEIATLRFWCLRLSVCTSIAVSGMSQDFNRLEPVQKPEITGQFKNVHIGEDSNILHKTGILFFEINIFSLEHLFPHSVGPDKHFYSDEKLSMCVRLSWTCPRHLTVFHIGSLLQSWRHTESPLEQLTYWTAVSVVGSSRLDWDPIYK